MKIAMVADVIYPFSVGGSEIRTHEIFKRLVQRGHECHIYGAKCWSGKNIIKRDGIYFHGLHQYTNLYNSNGKRSVTDPIKLSIKVFLNLRKKEFDIIDNQAFIFFNCYSLKLASFFNKTPIVFTWHQYFGDYLLGYAGKLFGNMARLLERGSIFLTKNNVSSSPSVKKELVLRGVKSERVHSIYNGINSDLIESARPFNKKYDLIFVGRLTYQKQIDLLINSLVTIKEKYPKIKLAIVGEGDKGKFLKNLVKRLNLEKNVEFMGEISQNNVYRYLKSSKIFVLPSRFEGFPLVLVEAAASKLPVVVTRCKWNEDEEFSKEISVFSKHDVFDFSQNIIELLGNKNKMRKMGDLAYKKSKDLDWEKITDKTERYYLEILEEKR